MHQRSSLEILGEGLVLSPRSPVIYAHRERRKMEKKRGVGERSRFRGKASCLLSSPILHLHCYHWVVVGLVVVLGL